MAIDLLQTGGEFPGLLACAGNIEQEEDHASVDGLEIEKVSPDPRSPVKRSHTGSLQGRRLGGLWPAKRPLHNNLTKRQLHKFLGKGGRIKKYHNWRENQSLFWDNL